jgi:hypothetical protein
MIEERRTQLYDRIQAGITGRITKEQMAKIRELRHVRTIWIADAHRDGKRFVVRADEKLTAFVELESATRIGSSPT